MTPKQRLLAAINRQIPDRLPVTTHHVMSYFLDKYLQGMDTLTFLKTFGFDPIVWTNPIKPTANQYMANDVLCSDDWRLSVTDIPGKPYITKRFTFATPKKELSTVVQYNEYTCWKAEPLVKEKSDIDIIAQYAPHPQCDVDEVNKLADEVGENALVRGFVTCFRPSGQPGCWQDVACLYGIEPLILEAFDDPEWVAYACEIVQSIKKTYIRSLRGARYDILEIGGGDASTTVISPSLFRQFVAPYDAPLINMIQETGIKVAYHTCGGMMPILEDIADMGPDAMETFTPPSMGADVDLAKAKARIGERVCMIGGFDQGHYLYGCTEEETRRAVRECFAAAGGNGGFILAPSDHFFDVDIKLLRTLTDEARKCSYT
ncbi:MAG: hypothetical protein FWG94_05840 [Oscillospiraceae bacterium]|nr:hypothetical protein [Oscillospiraceae bacterium]